ncbi:MAG: TRAP transporter substrate-binding protein, partial [Rhodospirillales bacterium]
GGYQGAGSIHSRAARLFGAALAREWGGGENGGALDFDFEPDILRRGHKSGDILPLVEHGTFDVSYMATIRFSAAVPELRLFELPFLIEDRAKIFKALDGALGDVFKKRILESTPFRILGFWDNGFRHLTNKVRPIRTPEDCRGLRLRIQMSDFLREGFERMGFEPVTIDIRDFLAAIATDMVDGQENPLTSIVNFGMEKHHRYITLTGHIFGVVLLFCNAATFASWPGPVRAAVERAAAEASLAQRELAAAEDARILKALDPAQNEVIEPSSAERAAFAATAAPLRERCRAALGPELFRHLA